MFDAPGQRVVDILLIIQLDVMPTGSLRETGRFAPLLIAIFLPSDQLVASTDSTGIGVVEDAGVIAAAGAFRISRVESGLV